MFEFEKLAGVDLDSTAEDFTVFVEPTDADVEYVIGHYTEGARRET